MEFRPLPLFTAVLAPLFLFLIGLGVWQVERLHWKLNLIAEVNQHMEAAPTSLDHMLAMDSKAAQYRRVRLTGHFLHDREAYVFTTGHSGQPVYHVLTPFVVSGARALLVDRGMVPIDMRNPATRPKGQVHGTQTIVGVWRIPDAPGLFTPAADTAHRIWYSRNVNAIAKADGIDLAAPVIVEADATPNPGGWPKGGQTVVHFRNHHLQYAITWFALAAGLMLVYLAYHRSQGRLKFRAKPKKS
jgi:surfeit locus 1 family protein